jgi:hypothetical protein
MLVLLLGLLMGSPKPLAFDPYSVLKVEYRAKDCKQNGEETVCKQATFTFGAVSSLRSPFNPDAPMTSSFVPQLEALSRWL